MLAQSVIERLKTNLIFEHSEENQNDAVGMLCIPFKNEDGAGAEELFQAIQKLISTL
jgi:hypothetical protein